MRNWYKQLWYLTFWSVTYSFQDRPGSKFGPPIENEKNRIFAVSVYIRLQISVICNPIVQLIYMGYADCETLQSLGLLLFLLRIIGCRWRKYNQDYCEKCSKSSGKYYSLIIIVCKIIYNKDLFIIYLAEVTKFITLTEIPPKVYGDPCNISHSQRWQFDSLCALTTNMGYALQPFQSFWYQYL